MKVASLTDYHEGDRNKISHLKQSGILRVGNIFLACDYTGFQTSDIEDMIGDAPYLKLINTCYGLSDNNRIKHAGSLDGKILSFVEDAMSRIEGVRFNHYAPSEFLLRHPDIWESDDIKDALDRFERLFKDLNALL